MVRCAAKPRTTRSSAWIHSATPSSFDEAQDEVYRGFHVVTIGLVPVVPNTRG